MSQTFGPPPPAPAQGSSILLWARDLTRWLKKTQAIPGAGLTSTQTGGGRVFNAKPGVGDVIAEDRPWQITRAGGLDVDMVDGILFTSSDATAVPVPQTVSTSTITLPNNATTKIWFKAEVGNTPWATFFVLWTVGNVTVESGSEVPEDTLDLSDIDDGDGDVFVLIAEVTTEGGEVASITQTLRDSYALIFPLAIDVAPFECPDPEEE